MQNFAHLANFDQTELGTLAKFNPKGLHLLLTKLKDASQDRFNELYEKGTVSPLHVAALNSNSVSLRYF